MALYLMRWYHCRSCSGQKEFSAIDSVDRGGGDTRRRIERLMADGKEIYLPVVLGGGVMYAVCAENLSDMYKGKLDILTQPRMS